MEKKAIKIKKELFIQSAKTKNIRDDYLENHVKWFLNNHNDQIEHFNKQLEKKYGTKLKIEPSKKVNHKIQTLFD